MCPDESKSPDQQGEGGWPTPPWGHQGPPWTQPGFEGPPWSREARLRRLEMRRHWRRRPGFVFLRFAVVFGVITLLMMGAIALFIFLLVGIANGDRHRAVVLWLGTCGMLLALPMLAVFLSRRAYRSIATPLAGMMDAADRVAEGDFSVRVQGSKRGDFSRLTDSFNHMVEELQLSDQRRRNLTADVAHELRTPLQIIQGNLEGVIDGVYAPTPEHIEATLEETRLLARLVEDLRVLSQAEAGQLAMNVEQVDVAELVADVVTSFSGQAQAAGVQLVAAALPAPSTLLVSGDYARLDQVLSNLVANAVRHTPEGGSVALRAEAMPDGVVRIEVADDGEGIAVEQLPYIFDRFWRGDRARTQGKGAGSGLGLAIAKELVEAHGGVISVESEVGEGTVFRIELPRGE